MSKDDLRKGWLTANAVTTFLVAMIIVRAPQSSADPYTVPIIEVTIPILPDCLDVLLAVVLIVLSIVLAMAVLIRPLRCWVFTSAYSAGLRGLTGFLAFAGFTVAFLESLSEVDGEFWITVLFFTGFGLFIFLGCTAVMALIRSSSAPESPCDVTERRRLKPLALVAVLGLVIWAWNRLSRRR